MPRPCSICGKPGFARGWCQAHYTRWRSHGHPLGGGSPKGKTAAEWLEQFLQLPPTDDCVIWPFSRGSAGYGRVTLNGRRQSASRAVCERVHGAAPTPGHEAAHSCGKGHTGCVNPRHLRWATCAENHADKLLHGTDNRGERHGQHVLARQDVLAIRSLRRDGQPRAQLARRFGIAATTVRDIEQGVTWGWLHG